MRSIVLAAIATTFLFALVPGSVGADEPKRAMKLDSRLTPTKPVDRAKIQQAKKLRADFEAGKLEPNGAKQYQAATRRLQQAARRGGAAGGMGKLAGGGAAESCQCTATCQTIVFMNGTEYEFEGSGTVSSPSACADAAEAFCGGAYSTWLSGWTCK